MRTLPLVLLLAACNRDTQVTARNAQPTAEITSHADGQTVRGGEPITLRGSGSDPDDVATDLIATWRVNDAVVCQGPIPDGGETSCETTFVSASADVSLTVTDPQGAVADAHVTLAIAANGAPTASWASPTASDVLPSGDPVFIDAIVGDVEDDAADLALVLSSNRDGVLAFDGGPDATGHVSAYVELSRGAHILTLDVTDTDFQTVRAQVAFRVNNPPSEPDIYLTPDPAGTADDVVVAFADESQDPDSDLVTHTFAWLRDGVPDSASTSAVLPASATARGETWTVRITPEDPYESGPTAEASITIGNTLPSVASADITPDPLSAGDTAACGWTGFDDADGDTDVSTVAWDVDGVAAGTGTLLVGGFARGDVVTCTVTPYDGHDNGAIATASLTVGNAAPSLAYATISPDPAQAGDTLTCFGTGFSDADGDSDQTTFAWAVNSAPVGTGSTYSGAFADGDTITCTATPYDGYEAGVPVVTSINIDASAPSIASVSITPDPAQADDVLTCGWTGFSDPDGDGDASTAAWTIDGVPAGTGTTLSSGYGYKDVVVCTVTPSDGTATGTPRSDSIVIGNTPPVLADAMLSPDPAYEGDTLVCTPGVTTDADGATAFTYTYSWEVSGADPGVTTATLGSSRWAKGDDVTCTATPSDGADSGTPATSDVVTISNTAPKITAVSLAPTTVYTDTPVVASPTASDADGESIAYSYAWTVNGLSVAATGNTLAGSYFKKGDVVRVSATPDDGDDLGVAFLSGSVTVVDSPPTMPVVAIDPVDPEEGLDDLVCEIVTPSIDADGDAITYAATWEVDGDAFSGALSSVWTGDTVPFTATTQRESWECAMTATAGSVSSAAATDVVTVVGEEIDWGNTQFPCSATSAAGAPLNLYGWVYHAGVTPGSGQGAGITAEAGIGPDGSDPATATGWKWVVTSYNGDKDGLSALANDEYWGIATAPSTAGTYDYAFRYSTDGGLSWKYADLGAYCGGTGTDDGYSASTSGGLTVTP